MRKMLLLAAAAFMAIASVQAQRRGCLHRSVTTRSGSSYMLPEPYKFDAQKTYRVPVVLFSFSDLDFSMDHPVAYYNRLFNEPGFNEGMGKGCVADYFRDQSAGRLNLQFDIYGPVKIDKGARDHAYHSDGSEDMRKALSLLSETTDADFTVYDWNGDGQANEVVFVAAGLMGNSTNGTSYLGPSSFFHIPNTQLPGGIDYYYYSLICERLRGDILSGIGTIVHEFCHSLGLPDLYPFGSGTAFSTVDEWDLMDGGNITNYGWCPPNLSAMERMYLGWDAPEELTAPTTVVDMKPLGEGGKTYLVRSTSNSNEFYLLENRRQEGWDYGCPGNGLLIFHVDFDIDAWRNCLVNTSDQHYRYGLFHASGMDFRAWCPKNTGTDYSRWTEDNWLRSRYLSTSPYPYADPTTLTFNNSLTDESSPAATLFTPAADGRLFMGKAITNIRLSADGTVSFDFMKGEETGIVDITTMPAGGNQPSVWQRASGYAIDGHRLPSRPTVKGLYIRRSASGGFEKCYMP